MKNLSLKISFILLTFFFFTSQKLISQDNDWNISLKQGLTYHFNKSIYEKGKTIDGRLYNTSIDAIYLDAGYIIAGRHEVGISIHKNLYTYPQEFIAGAIISYNRLDTTFLYASGYELRTFTSIGVLYAYHFLNDLRAGFRIGENKPVFPENDDSGFINLFFGKNFPVSKSLSISSELNFSSRTRAFKRFRSQQVNLLLGINYGL